MDFDRLFAPATTEEEAVALLRSGRYRWSLVDDGTGKETRKFGLTLVSPKGRNGIIPIKEPDFTTNEEAVLVIRPLPSSIHTTVPVIVTLEDAKDADSAVRYWDAMEEAAASNNEQALQAVRADRKKFFAESGFSDAVPQKKSVPWAPRNRKVDQK